MRRLIRAIAVGGKLGENSAPRPWGLAPEDKVAQLPALPGIFDVVDCLGASESAPEAFFVDRSEILISRQPVLFRGVLAETHLSSHVGDNRRYRI